MKVRKITKNLKWRKFNLRRKNLIFDKLKWYLKWINR